MRLSAKQDRERSASGCSRGVDFRGKLKQESGVLRLRVEDVHLRLTRAGVGGSCAEDEVRTARADHVQEIQSPLPAVESRSLRDRDIQDGALEVRLSGEHPDPHRAVGQISVDDEQIIASTRPASELQCPLAARRSWQRRGLKQLDP